MIKIRTFIVTFILSIIIIFGGFMLGSIKAYMLLILSLLSLTIHGMIIFFYLIYKRDYDNLNQTIENIINDNIDGKIITKFIKQHKLNANLNRIVKKIEKLSFKKEEHELTIRILTNNITHPIIYIDRDGRIRYTNHQFLNSIDANIEINDIYEKLRIQSIFKFIDDAFIFESKVSDYLSINDRFYHINAIPVRNSVYDIFSFIGILFIFDDITELKKYEVLQREFLADASHELKTPLSAIKGASEILLERENHSKATVREFLTIIKSENERMEKIVNDILLISRLENDKGIIHFEEVDLTKLIYKVVEILKPKINAKSQILKLNLTDKLMISGDYYRLKHVFLNLLLNSINYTDENKNIYVKSYIKDDNIVISIKDEGIGIAKEALPHIFERFYRIDKARSRETGGTGLGLAIVKSTLDIHKAKIEVNSILNEGTEFLIYFKENRN
jgi:two-component system phosphate regulon sensor histidine kinase PhoR